MWLCILSSTTRRNGSIGSLILAGLSVSHSKSRSDAIGPGVLGGVGLASRLVAWTGVADFEAQGHERFGCVPGTTSAGKHGWAPD